MTVVPATKKNSTLTAWSSSAADVLESLGVDLATGLDSADVLSRRRQWGRNQLEAAARRRVFSILLAQFSNVVVVLLVVAAVLAFLFSDFAEGLAIIAVVLINSMIGFLTEWRAERSMEALQQHARVNCVLLREGEIAEALAEELVPGDIVLLEAGDLVPADMRLCEATKLAVDESTLTGESLPVNKQIEILSKDAGALERHNMAFKGTAVTRGTGKGVVVGTGVNTAFGKIYEQVAEATPQQTPLEKRLNALGARLAWAIILIAIVVAAAGIVSGRDLFLAVEVAIALAVAAIPEGLAIVATIALARGMWRMAKRNALITRLSAVETLGATSVILTDKTGTLTENRMAVSCALLADGEILAQGMESSSSVLLDELLRTGVYCSNAILKPPTAAEADPVGDPTELALLVAASRRGIWREELLARSPEVHEDPFDPDSKRMATVHRRDDDYLVAVKGAPEAIIPCCATLREASGDCSLDDAQRDAWLARTDELGNRGLRTIALATKAANEYSSDLYGNLVLLGVVGLEDPARKGVDQAIRRCRDAGISVVMVTGDHAATARNIARVTSVIEEEGGDERLCEGDAVDTLLAEGRETELLEACVFSRVTPGQKLSLIQLHQKQGHVVAMTGDGVNDAPALKKADIGVAMGVRGTAVAKEAAVMVLQDDEFSTIVAAVEYGRVIFENIRKFVIYLLSCNASEVLVVGLATIAGAPLPLMPLQILFLNLITDVFPALALGVGEGAPGLMKRRPRPASERILMRSHWMLITIHGAIIATTVLAAMAISVFYLEFDQRRAVSVAFCTLALAQMWHVFNMRNDPKRVFVNEISRNRWIWAALGLCLLLVLAAVYQPVLRDVLELANPGTSGWLLIVPASLLPVLAAPFVSLLLKKAER